MHNIIADRMQNVTPFYVMSLLQRAKELEQAGRDIIHMEVGEPDFATPEKIKKAGINAIQNGLDKYTPAAGLPELRKKISVYYQQTYDVIVPEQRIFITPGASGALLLAFAASINPGDAVMQGDPGYPCNSNFLYLYGAEPLYVRVNAATSYQFNARLIQQHWTKKCRGVLIASPSNPTGTIITANDLKESIAMCERMGGTFYSDEIYHGLVYQRDAQTALKFSDKVFVINSFSKYFGMTGWRAGWLIAPEKYCHAIEKLAQNIFISTSSIAQHAALAAFDDETLETLEKRREEFAERGQYLYRQLQSLGFDVSVPPEGAFYVYANCNALTKNSFTFTEQLLEKAGVAITPGKDFGENDTEQYVRFAYTTSLENLKEGVKRLAEYIAENC